jgi:hypothetical protein
MLVVRLLQPLFRKLSGSSKPPSSDKAKNKNRAKNRDVDYSGYTAYEIEDADFEEVGSDRK